MQRAFAEGLARLQDPQPEDFSACGLRAVKPGTHAFGLFPLLALVSALGVLLVSLSYDLSQYGSLALEGLFLPGLLLIYVPCLARLLSPAPLRLERICLLCLVGMCFFLVQLMISPLYIAPYDAMLHWITADTILRTQHLFGVNSLLPVSPFYPGLEIVTNALSTMGGLDTFSAGSVVIAAARLLMILTLYLFYEQVTMSSRMAGIATMIYMTNPHFLFFDAIFSYETLALPIATFLLSILARSAPIRPANDAAGYAEASSFAQAGRNENESMENNQYRWMLVVAWLALVSLTITHHMTDYVFVGFLALWTVVSLVARTGARASWTGPRPYPATGEAAPRTRGILTAFAFSGLLFSVGYAFLLAGNPVWKYLSSYFSTALGELEHILFGGGTARQLFSAEGVPPAPLWDRLLMLGSLALATLGLPLGLVSLWKQYRHSVLAVTLGIVALAYPVTQAFRFSNYGSEITDRSAAFLFLPIGYVLALFITHYWPTRRLNRRATALISCALSIMLLGGALLETGPAYSGLPGPYQVIAGGRSIEPIGISAAQWSLIHLGSDNRVATDRVNQTLFATFGKQRIVSDQEDNVNIAPIFFSSQLDQETIATLRTAGIRYLIVDLRLSTSLPLLGFYYESDEPGAFHLASPINREALTKFSAMPQVNQVFDDGSIVIYDVGALTGQASRG